ncbi:hypothetical protein Dimus_038477 [Dionaea muscipula]
MSSPPPTRIGTGLIINPQSTTLTREEFIQMMAQIMVNFTAELWKQQSSSSSVVVPESPIPLTSIQMLPPPDAPPPRRTRRDSDRMSTERCRTYKARRTTRRTHPYPLKARPADRWCDFRRHSAHDTRDCRVLKGRGENRHRENRRRENRPRRSRPSSSRRKDVDKGPSPDSEGRRTSTTWKGLGGALQNSEEHTAPSDTEEQMEF